MLNGFYYQLVLFLTLWFLSFLMSGQQVHLLSNLHFHGIAHSKLLALKEEKEQIVQKFGVQVVYYLIIFCRVSVAGANWTGRFGAVHRAVWHGTIIAAKVISIPVCLYKVLAFLCIIK